MNSEGAGASASNGAPPPPAPGGAGRSVPSMQFTAQMVVGECLRLILLAPRLLSVIVLSPLGLRGAWKFSPKTQRCCWPPRPPSRASASLAGGGWRHPHPQDMRCLRGSASASAQVLTCPQIALATCYLLQRTSRLVLLAELAGVTADRDHLSQQRDELLAQEFELAAQFWQCQAENRRWRTRVAGLEAQMRHLQARQVSRTGSKADAEAPPAPSTPQPAAAAGAAPLEAAAAPQQAVGGGGEEHGAGEVAGGPALPAPAVHLRMLPAGDAQVSAELQSLALGQLDSNA